MTEKTGVIGGLDLPEKAEQSRRIIVIIIIFGTPNPYNVPREQEYSVELSPRFPAEPWRLRELAQM